MLTVVHFYMDRTNSVVIIYFSLLYSVQIGCDNSSLVKNLTEACKR